MDSITQKIFCPTRWTIRAASLRAILKNNETLMKLCGWAQDNVSDSDMKARIIGVHTKIQLYLPIEISSALAFREQIYVQCLLKRMPNFRSIFFVVYDKQGYKPPLDQGHLSCCEVEITSTPTSMSP